MFSKVQLASNGEPPKSSAVCGGYAHEIVLLGLNGLKKLLLNTPYLRIKKVNPLKNMKFIYLFIFCSITTRTKTFLGSIINFKVDPATNRDRADQCFFFFFNEIV